MASSSSSPARGPAAASFSTQADALLRKNLTFQKRNWKTNVCLLAFPIGICLLLVLLQALVNNALKSIGGHCECHCVDVDGDGKCEQVCDTGSSTRSLAFMLCPVPSPPKWPPLLQVPPPGSRAVRVDYIPYMDLPDESCKRTRTCPATVLFTGKNQNFAKRLARNLFMSSFPLSSKDYWGILANFVLGTDSDPGSTQFIEPAFFSGGPLYVLQPKCIPNFTLPLPLAFGELHTEVKCIEGLPLWRETASLVNDELFKGFPQGNSGKKSNDIAAAYDFLSSNNKEFAVNIWYNATHNGGDPTRSELLRVPRTVNMASNAYLHHLRGSDTRMQFEYVKEMPKPAKPISLDLVSLIGVLFFVWIIELLFPVMLTYLVYEKQHKLRLMMRMLGLGNGPYWIISYSYFLITSCLYMLCFVIFGSLIGFNLFRANSYSIQFVFYFVYINLQIALAFFAATYFSDVKTATVLGYIYVFASAILGSSLFQFLVEDKSFSRTWVLVMEIIPGFSLYRGLYEFSQYSLFASNSGTSGMQWGNLDDSENGTKGVLILMSIEWLVLLLCAFYLDQVGSSGIRKIASSLSAFFRKKPSLSSQSPGLLHQESKVCVEMEKQDVVHEREVVQTLLLEPHSSYALICNNLKKVYPARDGNPEKIAVQGLSLALPRGECFGMLGPNGAGKTSWISMMIGLTTPTSGTAYVQGMDIRTDMDKVHTGMGVCPQYDLLWESLTGREHLLFYGRLKNLKGAELSQAVEDSLKRLNLFHGGVADKQAGKYSGGMKRRLSVAISLIGDPKVVYMDEPSTGLDPASRNHLWNVIKQAKRDRAIILTTHSMEEAEVLCDRLGIFVDGRLQCIGSPAELKARYGGTYILTITTSAENEEDVEHLAQRLTPNAAKIYHISGTQKFEMPKQEVTIADVFRAVEHAKSRFAVQAWGLADTTLEDVFIKVARVAAAFNTLS